MFKFSELEQLHLEITNNCQASCPMCTRNIHGGVENPLIKITEWSLDDYQKIISPEVINQLRTVYFCGNFGDPLLNNHLLEMVEYTKNIKPSMDIRIHTNGSLRSKAWWKNLASVMPERHSVVFAIDGLEDTNHIYRIGTNYNKIIENAKSFIDAGGKAEWAFIRFKHNEHQVDEARRRAKELGFDQFTMKDSSRFLFDPKFPVYNKNKETIYHIEPSQWSELKFIDRKVVENYKAIVEKTTVDCYAVRVKEAYITAQGHLFPCCQLAMIPYQAPEEVHGLTEIRRKILDQYNMLVDSLGGLDAISTLKTSVKEIIDSDAYQSVWNDYWTTNKLITCVRSCGVIPEVFSTPKDQFTSREKL